MRRSELRQKGGGGSADMHQMRAIRGARACRRLERWQLLVAIALIGLSAGCAGTAPKGQEPVGTAAAAPQQKSSEKPDLDYKLIAELMGGTPYEGDCDANGIPDSVDVAQGYAHDTNLNGVPDYCEREFPTGSYDPDFRRWSKAASVADTLALCRVFGVKIGYGIHCYVPADGGDARLTVHSMDGKLLATISECVRTGASHYAWPLRSSGGLLAEADMEYYLSLKNGSGEVRQLVRWRREFRF